MPSLPVLVTGYLIAMVLAAWFAVRRGRSAIGWVLIAGVLTPVLGVILLWFLRDLEHERHQTREFLHQAKQRRNRRDPHDTFSRTRERQEQEIHTKVITTRRERQRVAAAGQPDTTRRLRSRESRTPATAIMEW